MALFFSRIIFCICFSFSVGREKGFVETALYAFLIGLFVCAAYMFPSSLSPEILEGLLGSGLVLNLMMAL